MKHIVFVTKYLWRTDYNILTKSVIKIIAKKVQDSRYFQHQLTQHLILYTQTSNATVIFVPIRSHTGMKIAGLILTFHAREFDWRKMSSKCKGDHQRIKDVCRYAKFCLYFVHSRNLVGSCTVETNAAAADFFLMI